MSGVIIECVDFASWLNVIFIVALIVITFGIINYVIARRNKK